MIMQLIRWPLGQLILAVDALTAPKPPVRAADVQARINEATRDLALYQFRACPFCVKTRRALRRLGLHIELRDAKGDAHWRSELLNEGGRIQVPCLRIPRPDGSVQWLYESDDIIAHLEQLVADRQISAAA